MYVSIGASQPYNTTICKPAIATEHLFAAISAFIKCPHLVALCDMKPWPFTELASCYEVLGTTLSTISDRHDGCEDGLGPLE